MLNTTVSLVVNLPATTSTPPKPKSKKSARKKDAPPPSSTEAIVTNPATVGEDASTSPPAIVSSTEFKMATTLLALSRSGPTGCASVCNDEFTRLVVINYMMNPKPEIQLMALTTLGNILHTSPTDFAVIHGEQEFKNSLAALVADNYEPRHIAHVAYGLYKKIYAQLGSIESAAPDKKKVSGRFKSPPSSSSSTKSRGPSRSSTPSLARIDNLANPFAHRHQATALASAASPPRAQSLSRTMFAGAAAAAKSRSVIIHITPAHGRGSGWSLPAPVLAAVSAVLLRTAGVVSFSMENNHDETDGSDTKVTTARARFYVRMLASLVITDILELLARAVPADLAQQYLMVSALDSGETSSVANIKDVGALARSNWSGYLIVGASGGSAETPKGKGTWDLVDRALEEEEEATEVADEDDDGHQIMEDEPYSVSHRSAPTGFLDEDEDDPYAVNDADNAAKVAVRESGGEAGAGKNGWLGRVGGWLGW